MTHIQNVKYCDTAFMWVRKYLLFIPQLLTTNTNDTEHCWIGSEFQPGWPILEEAHGFGYLILIDKV